ncbi:transposase [Mesorhizobium sp. M0195]|uniref:transposase n=1 Tax=unclassified Mesorhizobium TaxID=325217 RepID=UPI003336C442
MIREQIKAIEEARLSRLEQAPVTEPHAMVRLIASVIDIGVETADMLVQEVLSRNLQDRRAVVRYAGLTGVPDESGSKRWEKGLAKAGNAGVRRGADPVRLALPAVPERQRARPMVPGANRWPERFAQGEKVRSTRPQAAHRVVAHGHDWRHPGRRRAAAAGLSRLGGIQTSSSASGRLSLTGRR